jgi:hypothetical protein
MNYEYITSKNQTNNTTPFISCRPAKNEAGCGGAHHQGATFPAKTRVFESTRQTLE